ncbi:Serine/threonine-protein kinase [Ceratobasidium sp. AG-Ba]|nr:Serine/threonine-protein kinase [Ceratobasidium sp. AG-Ba]
MILRLVEAGCKDVGDQIDLNESDVSPCNGGGFGDIYYGVSVNGVGLAIKCPRLHLKQDQQGNEMLKPMKFTYGRKSNIPMCFSSLDWQHSKASTQISSGLAYLHRSNTIHGDLKAANVLIDEVHCVKITDFGNAMAIKHTLQFTGGNSGNMAISMRWTAPEIFKGETLYTQEGDVYALGMTILETFTGKAPFTKLPDHAVVYQITNGRRPERPPEMTSDELRYRILWLIVESCWQESAANRPSAAKVENNLSALLIHAEAGLSVASSQRSAMSGKRSKTDRLKEREIGWNTDRPAPEPSLMDRNKKRRPNHIVGQRSRGRSRSPPGSPHGEAKIPKKHNNVWNGANGIKPKDFPISARTAPDPSSIIDTATTQSPAETLLEQNSLDNQAPQSPTSGGTDVPAVRSPVQKSAISSKMSTELVISQLVKKGCPNVTQDLDIEKCEPQPFAGGGFGDVYHGMLKGGKKVAIKLSETGEPKIADFGNTVLRKYTIDFTGGTTTLKVSVRWTAPELFQEDAASFTKPADVFALGMTPKIPAELEGMTIMQADLLRRVMKECWSQDPSQRPDAAQIELKLRSVEGPGN